MTNEQLVTRIQAGENTAANMLQLWQQNKAFVAMLARKYKGYAEIDDLMQEGYLGLNDAVEHYDIDSGCPFISYAAFWIRQKMRRYIERSGVIRLPAEMYQSVIKYKSLVSKYVQEHGCEPSDEVLMDFLGMDEEELDKVRKAARKEQTKSLDAVVSEDDDSLTLMDLVASDQNLEEDAIRKRDCELMSAELWEAIGKLPENQAFVIAGRYQDKRTHKSLGREMGCSFQYVRSLEQHALRTLRRPHISRKFRPYFEQYISAADIHHTGVASFQCTWTSSVERDAIKNEQNRERVRETKDRLEIEQLFAEWEERLRQTEDVEEFERLQEQFKTSLCEAY